VLGEEFTYALTTRLISGESETVRREHWTYLVRDVDEFGVFTLRGLLTAFGVNSRLNGVEAPPANMESATASELERLSDLELIMGLSMDGRVSWSDGLPWADNLPHTLIGLPLPLDAVFPGTIWSDPSGLRPLSGVFPDELAVDLEEEHRFDGLANVNGDLRATIVTEGLVRSEWSLSRGVLLSRTLTVALDDPERLLSEVGRELVVTISRVE
jgi:hypothetical protein